MAELLEYETVGKFLADLKKEFGEEVVKIAELKRLEKFV